MKKIILILTALIFNNTNAQQTINASTFHDWEDNRYINNNDNTITDSQTTLMWQQCPQGLTGNNCDIGVATTVNWEEALELANNSTFAGFSDWRLPNIKELRSIVAYDRYNPSINLVFFPNTPSDNFWSASPDIIYAARALKINFISGTSFDVIDRDDDLYVRLVRDN